MSIKQSIKEGLNNFISFLDNSKIEIVLASALATGIGAPIIISNEKDYADDNFLAFSEMSQRLKDSWKEDQPVTFTNLYSMAVNDEVMKILESENESDDKKDDLEAFWIQLDKHNNRKYNIKTDMYKPIEGHRFTIEDLTQMVPEIIDSVKTEIRDHRTIGQQSGRIRNALDKAWSESHHDNYHTEVYFVTVTSTDANGNVTSHQEMRTRQVYDDTDHYFDYTRSSGKEAIKLADDLFLNIPTIKMPVVKTASKTNPENEYAIKQSRKKVNKDKEYSESEFKEIADTWYKASVLLENLRAMDATYSAMKRKMQSWKNIEPIADEDNTYHYNTTSHRHPGPQEHQVARAAESTAKEMNFYGNNIESCFEKTGELITELKQNMELYQEIMKGNIQKEDEGYRKPWKVKDDIIDGAKELYNTNFKNGIDMNRFRYGRTIGLILALGAIGAAAGFGLDRWAEATNFYDKFSGLGSRINKGIQEKNVGYYQSPFEDHWS